MAAIKLALQQVPSLMTGNLRAPGPAADAELDLFVLSVRRG
jgi:hypothetical protein